MALLEPGTPNPGSIGAAQLAVRSAARPENHHLVDVPHRHMEVEIAGGRTVPRSRVVAVVRLGAGRAASIGAEHHLTRLHHLAVPGSRLDRARAGTVAVGTLRILGGPSILAIRRSCHVHCAHFTPLTKGSIGRRISGPFPPKARPGDSMSRVPPPNRGAGLVRAPRGHDLEVRRQLDPFETRPGVALAHEAIQLARASRGPATGRG